LVIFFILPELFLTDTLKSFGYAGRPRGLIQGSLSPTVSFVLWPKNQACMSDFNIEVNIQQKEETMKKEKSKQAEKPKKTKEMEEMEPCKIAPDPEHQRLTEKDEPCDDARGGKK
jgi:hypothetical protein